MANETPDTPAAAVTPLYRTPVEYTPEFEACMYLPRSRLALVKRIRTDAQLQDYDLANLTDSHIYRCYKGDGGDVDKAFNRVKSTLAWRKEFDYEAIFSEDFGDIAAIGKLCRLPVPTADGYTVFMWRTRLHVPGDAAATRRLIRFFIREIAGGWRDGTVSDKMLLLVDRSDATPANRDLNMAIDASKIFNVHFPEIMHRLYIFPSGWLVTAAWAIVKAFLDPATRDKAVMVNQADIATELDKVLGLDNVPERLGGRWTGEPEPASKT
ncbi:hypothetical protein RI367_006866 [Sorochytrium milnesiophthora]